MHRIVLSLFILFLIVGLAGCADTTADEDQIESDGENGGDAEIDETDSESDDTENESETVPGADNSDAGPDDTTEQDDDEISDREENDDVEVSEDEIETTEEEEDSIAESVTTVNDFERELSNEGIDIHTTDFDEDGFEDDSSLAWSLFEYHSDENIEAGETDELRLIAKAYAGLIDSGYQTTELEVAQFDPDSPVDYPWASYRIETVWAEDYNDGLISEEEYFELIIEEYQVIEDL